MLRSAAESTSRATTYQERRPAMVCQGHPQQTQRQSHYSSPLISINRETHTYNDHSRIQVPINVAMEEPRARVVRKEPDCDIVPSASTNTDNITNNRVDEVVARVASAADHVEIVPM